MMMMVVVVVMVMMMMMMMMVMMMRMVIIIIVIIMIIIMMMSWVLLPRFGKVTVAILAQGTSLANAHSASLFGGFSGSIPAGAVLRALS